jgi:hypothetical protein
MRGVADDPVTTIAHEADVADSERWKRRNVALRPVRNDAFAADVRDTEAVRKGVNSPRSRILALSAVDGKKFTDLAHGPSGTILSEKRRRQ